MFKEFIYLQRNVTAYIITINGILVFWYTNHSGHDINIPDLQRYTKLEWNVTKTVGNKPNKLKGEIFSQQV